MNESIKFLPWNTSSQNVKETIIVVSELTFYGFTLIQNVSKKRLRDHSGPPPFFVKTEPKQSQKPEAVGGKKT